MPRYLGVDAPARGGYIGRMSTPDIHSIARQLAVLEERMNTYQADYRTDIARLAEDMAKRDAEQAKRDAEQAKRDADLKADIAKRDKDNQRFLVNLLLVLFGVLVAIIIGGFTLS
ncbi:MAG: hypothetical protein GDA52_07890 [Rhodobacteraceae bacterium]|nr:hypothetical protein [Paracoccaceae bacterium]